MDRTANQKDTSGVTQDTSGGGQQTSEQPETFTREQYEEAKTKAVSDALSIAGRTAKALEVREKAIRSAEERAAQKQKENDERELEDARDDIDKQALIRRQQALRDTKAELAKVMQELEEERTKGKQRDEEAVETNREILAFGIATKYSVDAETLKNLSKHTDGSTEAIEVLAQALPKKGGAKTPLITDTGKTIGGGGTLTVEMVEKMSPEERFARAEEIAKMPLGYKSLA